MLSMGGAKLKLMRTLTFENTNEQVTITPDATWGQYDILMFVPDLQVVAQEGQTSGNWLYFNLKGSRGTAEQYDGNAQTGARDVLSTVFIAKGWNSDRYYWRFMFMGGRGGIITLKEVLDINSETFSDLTYTYGAYRQGTNALLNGTVKIYGGKFE